MVIVDNPYFTVKRAEAQRTERFSWGSIVSHWLSQNICAVLFTWPVIPSKPGGGNLKKPITPAYTSGVIF